MAEPMSLRRLVPMLAIAFTSLAFAPNALAEDAPPTVTLLSPAHTSTVISDAEHLVRFTWRVESATPTDTTVTWEVASDPFFKEALPWFGITRQRSSPEADHGD